MILDFLLTNKKMQAMTIALDKRVIDNQSYNVKGKV